MAYQKRRKNETDFFSSVLLILARALWSLVIWPFRRGRTRRIDQAVYRAHWRTIAATGQTANDHARKQAILDADKLVDQVFRDLSIPGKTFGERLRAAEGRLHKTTYQDLWDAHKLRNQIAHEVGYTVTEYEAEQALSQFERGLRALGAL